MQHNDAFGAPVKVGKVYGYTTTVNGIGSVVICEVVKLNESSVSVSILNRKKFLYGKPIESANAEPGAKQRANVHAYNLFPVPTELVA